MVSAVTYLHRVEAGVVAALELAELALELWTCVGLVAPVAAVVLAERKLIQNHNRVT